jgi:hypothetical protein
MLLGFICNYIINEPNDAEWIWLLTLIIGGIPGIWDTGKGI